MRRKWVIAWVLSIVVAWLAWEFRAWAYSDPGRYGSCTASRAFDDACWIWTKEKLGDLLVWGSLLGVLTLTIALATLRTGRGSRASGDDTGPVDSVDRGPAKQVSDAPEVDREPLSAASRARDEPHGDIATRPTSHLVRSLGVAIVVAGIALALFFVLLGLMMNGIWND